MTPGTQWLPPPHRPLLTDTEIHVWRTNLDLAAPLVQRLTHLLAPDEAQRAARFHFEVHRNRFIVGRSFLRMTLARYSGLDPHALEFSYGPYGKPALKEHSGGDTYTFNLAHSHTLALCAITTKRAIGIDIEQIRPLPDLDQIAGHFFSSTEKTLLSTLAPEQKLHAFYTYWTCKEAYLKAHGGGLSWGLDKVTVALEHLAFSTIDEDQQEAARWCLQQVWPAAGFLAALTVRGEYSPATCYNFSQDL